MEPLENKVMMSSLVWVIMFSILMTFSIISNVFYIFSFIHTKRKPTVIHLLIFFFFIINLLEYLSLVLDWSSSWSPETQGPSASLCSLFMFLTQVTAVLRSSTALMLVYFIYFPFTRSLSDSKSPTTTYIILPTPSTQPHGRCTLYNQSEDDTTYRPSRQQTNHTPSSPSPSRLPRHSSTLFSITCPFFRS